MATTAEAYILGRTEAERNRLRLQGSILSPITETFLRMVGISEGMRVLDLGCGIGEVTLLAAKLTGPDGHVVGIDIDPHSVVDAAARARDQGCANATFECCDLAQYNPPHAFDAVIGRHILIHSHAPQDVVGRAALLVRPGGIVGFQEYDLSFYTPGYPAAPLATLLEQRVVSLFRMAAPHANIGMRLYHLLQTAGFTDLQCRAECLIDGGPDSPFYDWFAETVRSLLPKMIAARIATAGEFAPDLLAGQLRDEALATASCITTPLIVSGWARRPIEGA